MKIKPSSYCSGQEEDLIVLRYEHEEAHTLPELVLNWAIRCSHHSEHSANRPTASWQSVWDASLREGEREGDRDRGRKGGIVGGGGDALGDFASVLCTAIVHQSLLEAKPVRTEQRFPRDLSLSAGMPKRKFNHKTGSDGWTDTLALHCHTFTLPLRRDNSERLRDQTSNWSCIIAKVKPGCTALFSYSLGVIPTAVVFCKKNSD